MINKTLELDGGLKVEYPAWNENGLPATCPMTGEPNYGGVCLNGCPYHDVHISQGDNPGRHFICAKIALDLISLGTVALTIPQALTALTEMGGKFNKNPIFKGLFGGM